MTKLNEREIIKIFQNKFHNNNYVSEDVEHFKIGKNIMDCNQKKTSPIVVVERDSDNCNRRNSVFWGSGNLVYGPSE